MYFYGELEGFFLNYHLIFLFSDTFDVRLKGILTVEIIRCLINWLI